MNPAHQKLFEPFRFPCGAHIDNRLVVAPMTTWSSNPDGTIHEDELRYIKRRCGGFGAWITSACYVIPEGKAFPGQWSCHVEEMIPSLAKVAEVIHAGGSKAILQLHHGGRMSPAAVLGHAPLCPSAVPAIRPDADIPRAMTGEEIRATIDAFGQAARRALEAGYDGVELHGANTYLLQQFFSPHSNRREDEWGGSLENRLRFPLACIEAMRDAVKPATGPFIIGYRLTPEEIEEPGISMEDMLLLVERLAGQRLDYIHVSCRNYNDGLLRDYPFEERLNLTKQVHVFERAPFGDPQARATKRILDQLQNRIPVIGVGRVINGDDSLAIRNDGCEFVAVGRIVLTEPEWLEKIRDGRENEIRSALPAIGGDEALTLPKPMYQHLLAMKGWVPVE